MGPAHRRARGDRPTAQRTSPPPSSPWSRWPTWPRDSRTGGLRHPPRGGRRQGVEHRPRLAARRRDHAGPRRARLRDRGSLAARGEARRGRAHDARLPDQHVSSRAPARSCTCSWPGRRWTGTWRSPGPRSIRGQPHRLGALPRIAAHYAWWYPADASAGAGGRATPTTALWRPTCASPTARRGAWPGDLSTGWWPTGPGWSASRPSSSGRWTWPWSSSPWWPRSPGPRRSRRPAPGRRARGGPRRRLRPRGAAPGGRPPPAPLRERGRARYRTGRVVLDGEHRGSRRASSACPTRWRTCGRRWWHRSARPRPAGPPAGDAAAGTAARGPASG